jgi:UrcA family protein
MRKTCFSLIAAVVFAGASAPAQADMVTIRVSTENLDLTTDAGLAELERRVEVAAWDACSMDQSSIQLQRPVDRSCLSAMIQGAAVQIQELRTIALESAKNETLAMR